MSNTTESRQKLIVQDDSAVANLMDTGRFEHMFRIAGAMSAASLIPEHLLGIKKAGTFTAYTPEQVKANCFLIVNQSLRWGLDPFAVMPETYVVGGKLAYQGKLIAAVVNARADLTERLAYSFTGKIGSDDLTVTVSGRFRGASKPSEITLSVGQAKTDNQMWRKDPEQKLIYSGVVKWARRYCPEIVLGITMEDEHDDMRDVTPRSAAPAAPTANPYKDAAVEVASTPSATLPPAEQPAGPDREALKAQLKEGIKTHGRKNIEALEIFRTAGLLDKPQISDATDAELASMVKNLNLLAKKEEAPTDAAPQEEPGKSAKETLLDQIEEAGLGMEPALKLNQIEAACRKVGVLSATGTLKGAKEDRLAGILANLADIVAKAEGGEA